MNDLLHINNDFLWPKNNECLPFEIERENKEEIDFKNKVKSVVIGNFFLIS